MNNIPFHKPWIIEWKRKRIGYFILLWASLCFCYESYSIQGDEFERSIRPILVEHCYECHSEESGKSKGDLRLDQPERIMRGGEGGGIIEKGNSQMSRLFQLISHREPEERMPPKYRLPEAQIELIKKWIDLGAELPDYKHSVSNPDLTGDDRSYPKDWEGHWAFQSIRSNEDQVVLSNAISSNFVVRNPIDRFIVRELEKEGLIQSPRSEWGRLVRRLFLDVTGLPPTEVEMNSFLSDPSIEKYETLVEELLSRETYGEHWSRMWLDVVRYADSNGSDENLFFANAYKYRNYVIHSFNQDKPYFDFIKEQIIGDKIAVSKSGEFNKDAFIATGFLNLGPKLVAEQDKEKLVMDLIDEQVDVLGQTFLGMSFGCARCHDHKFDPITQEDYFAMAGIFRSSNSMQHLNHVSRWLEKPIEHPDTTKERNQINKHIEESEKKLSNSKMAFSKELGREIRSHSSEALVSALSGHKYYLNGRDLELSNRWKSILEGDHKSQSAWSDLIKNEIPFAKESQLRVGSQEIKDSVEKLFARIRSKALNSTHLTYEEDSVLGTSIKTSNTSHVEFDHRDTLEATTLSILSWIKIKEPISSDKDDRKWVISKSGNEHVDGHYALGIHKDVPMAYLNIGGGKNNAIYLSGPQRLKISMDKWNLLSLTISQTKARLYLNGKLVRTKNLPMQRSNGTGPLAIGKRQDNYNYFQGLIDESVIYNRILTPDEILHIYKDPTVAKSLKGLVFKESFDKDVIELRKAASWDSILNDFRQNKGPFALPEKPERYFSAKEKKTILKISNELEKIRSKRISDPGTAMTIEDAEPVNLKIQVRGNHLTKKGDKIQRRPPMKHLKIDVSQVHHEKMSGRTQLAEWISSPLNPLTSRVMVNRLWNGCFGKGLVDTPNNFGRRGSQPTHPELLDWLAQEFINNGGSVKSLLKEIFTSHTYMQESKPNSHSLTKDPSNKFLWRMSPRRMTVEQLRDSMIYISGSLKRGIQSQLAKVNNYAYVPRNKDFQDLFKQNVRTIYLPVVRDRIEPDMEIFDFANPGVSSGFRQVTTVPLQALYFLNNERVYEWSQSTVEKALASQDPIQFLFKRILNRPPSPKELDAIEVIHLQAPKEEMLLELCLTLFSTNEFIYRL